MEIVIYLLYEPKMQLESSRFGFAFWSLIIHHEICWIYSEGLGFCILKVAILFIPLTSWKSLFYYREPCRLQVVDIIGVPKLQMILVHGTWGFSW